MNQKGFTLVELLAMMVVLSILLGITIPNISGILKRNKENAYLDDASRMYESAKVQEAIKKNIKPTSQNYCTLLHLQYLDRNDDFKKGPNGGTYDKQQSFVLIRLKSINTSGTETKYTYEYYVRLVENNNGKKQGVTFSAISKVNSKDYSIIQSNLNDIGFVDDDNVNLNNINNHAGRVVCSDLKTITS